MSQEKKEPIIKGLIIVGASIAIMVVLGLVSNAISAGLITGEGITKNTQFGDNILIENIKTSDVHYIDETLINVPLSIHYEIVPENASDKDIYIVSSDNSIVEVNDDNTITALKTGEATLTLVANDGSNVTSNVRIVIE